jgi:hypothetical protein
VLAGQGAGWVVGPGAVAAADIHGTRHEPTADVKENIQVQIGNITVGYRRYRGRDSFNTEDGRRATKINRLGPHMVA